MTSLSTPQPMLIRKGETYRRVLRLHVKRQQYLTINAAGQGAPCLLGVPDHGLLGSWRINRITSVQGMRDINTHRLQNGVWVPTPLGLANENGLPIDVLDANTLILPTINASSYALYQSGGVIEYFPPVPLAGCSAALQVRDHPGADAVRLDLNTTNNKIVLDAALNTVTITIPVAEVDALTFQRGVATLELTDAAGVRTLLMPNRPVIVGDTNVTR